MLLLVGLGNPGPEYQGNRHNIGFLAVEEIARHHNFGGWRKRFHGRAAEGAVGDHKVIALEPLTYMNLSGQAASAALAFYKLTPDQMIVCHDDIDLAPGKIKVKKGGGAGGHNGLRSIDQHLGPDYWRLRLGVGHPGHRDLVHNYVLHDFAKADLDWLDPLLVACATAFPLLAAGQPERFSTKVALLTQPPKPKPSPPPQDP